MLWDAPQKCRSRVYLQEGDSRSNRRTDWNCRSGCITEVHCLRLITVTSPEPRVVPDLWRSTEKHLAMAFPGKRFRGGEGGSWVLMGRTAAGPVVQSHKHGSSRGADRDHRSCRPGAGRGRGDGKVGVGRWWSGGWKLP